MCPAYFSIGVMQTLTSPTTENILLLLSEGSMELQNTGKFVQLKQHNGQKYD